MDNTTPRPKPAPPKTALQPVMSKDESPVERCSCGRFPGQVNEECWVTRHRPPLVPKPHLTDRPFASAILKLRNQSNAKNLAEHTSQPSKEKN